MLRGRIETVIDVARARAHGHIDENRVNPARWRHLAKILPKPAKLTRGHHAAMPYADIPAFMAKLRSSERTADKALALNILCASRPGEVLGMTRNEVLFPAAAKKWTVPAERMKKGVEHVVPLSDAAVDLVCEQTKGTNHTHVFPGARPRQAAVGLDP
jgi:integrase